MSFPAYDPMLATSWPKEFSDPGWTFELKVDGVRVVLHAGTERDEARTRRGRDVLDTYPELGAFRPARPVVLDGEVVAPDENGKPSFGLLQGRMNLANAARIAEMATRVPIGYVVFDLLHDGEPLIDRPVEERQERLAELELPPAFVRSQVIDGDGEALWTFVVNQGHEGMVAKRKGSVYRPGLRSPDWRKVAHRLTMQGVVGGFTPGEGSRAGTFGSVLVGLWDGGRLRWVGAVGSGFDDASLTKVKRAFDEIGVAESPFHADPDFPKGCRWVDPVLVASVEYKEWTHASRLRAPVFKGFTDTASEEVTWAAEGPG